MLLHNFFRPFSGDSHPFRKKEGHGHKDQRDKKKKSEQQPTDFHLLFLCSKIKT
jgi:hypothetical protein